MKEDLDRKEGAVPPGIEIPGIPARKLVKYSNQFNAQALRKFTALDLDLLMAIAARVRDKESVVSSGIFYRW